MSPASARHDRQLKRRRYQRARVPEYWVVDLESRIVERCRPDDERPEILVERLAWEPNPRTVALEMDLVKFVARVCGGP